MVITVEEGPVARRRLILRDSLGILTLLFATAALFAVTLFLFRSFRTHRAELALRWSGRGRAALEAGKPDEAITELRTALVYSQEGSADTREYQMLLAEALGQTHRPEQAEESYQYFMDLWQAEPGYGPINLQLARLARKRNKRQDAVKFYRAAIYGTWQGDGLEQRSAVRLELAQYLIDQHDLASARLELLIAAGNAPESYGRSMQIGGLLEQAGDADDAETLYRHALKDKPRDAAARAAIARIEASAAAAEAAAAAAVVQGTVNAPSGASNGQSAQGAKTNTGSQQGAKPSAPRKRTR